MEHVSHDSVNRLLEREHFGPQDLFEAEKDKIEKVAMTRKQTVFNEELVSELAKGCKTQDDLFFQEGIFKQLMKAVLEKSLDSELTNHLGYENQA